MSLPPPPALAYYRIRKPGAVLRRVQERGGACPYDGKGRAELVGGCGNKSCAYESGPETGLIGQEDKIIRILPGVVQGFSACMAAVSRVVSGRELELESMAELPVIFDY